MSARKSVTPAATPLAEGGDWDAATLLRNYAVPLGAVAMVGAGAMYFAKRMNDLESRVGEMRRNEVRHLSETDVRMIVQQMSRDGLIQLRESSTHPPAAPVAAARAAPPQYMPPPPQQQYYVPHQPQYVSPPPPQQYMPPPDVPDLPEGERSQSWTPKSTTSTKGQLSPRDNDE